MYSYGKINFPKPKRISMDDLQKTIENAKLNITASYKARHFSDAFEKLYQKSKKILQDAGEWNLEWD